jgi:hypothetical protein
MVSPKLLAPLIALGVLAPGYAAIAAARGLDRTAAGTKSTPSTRSTPPHTPTPAPKTSPQERALYESSELWATVDVCNPKDQLDTIGIRGSMPSDDHKGDTIYMRFRVQYEEASSKKWVDIAKGADSGFQPVHTAGAASQAGRNFQLVPTAAGAFTLRGVVSFQWRRGARVVYATTRPTTASHESLAGADPKGFSAATCTIA